MTFNDLELDALIDLFSNVLNKRMAAIEKEKNDSDFNHTYFQGRRVHYKINSDAYREAHRRTMQSVLSHAFNLRGFSPAAPGLNKKQPGDVSRDIRSIFEGLKRTPYPFPAWDEIEALERDRAQRLDRSQKAREADRDRLRMIASTLLDTRTGRIDSTAPHESNKPKTVASLTKDEVEALDRYRQQRDSAPIPLPAEPVIPGNHETTSPAQ